MKKINPNSFFTFRGHFLNGNKESNDICELILPWKRITHIEKNTEDYTLCTLGGQENKVKVYYTIDKEQYESIKERLLNVDFDIPVIETIQQIREAVKEEVNKVKANSPVDLLEI